MGSLYGNIMSKSFDYFNGLTWDNIVWSNSYDKIRRIQKRIFKASLLGHTKRVWFLQKLVLRNPHAKLIAVQTVTTLNKGKKSAEIDRYTATSSEEKLKLAKNLWLNGKANVVKRVWIPKPRKNEKRPLGIPTIQDRAKQALCKLALEPEWEAKFEPNSYGFRPGRRTQDAIEAISLCLDFNIDKYVFAADIRKRFEKINHEVLLSKLETFPLMKDQISAWLKAGIFDQYASTPKISKGTEDTFSKQGGIISPLLANIALHGLEDHLLSLVSGPCFSPRKSRKFPKPHENAARGTKAKRSALGIVRYADDFVIIHRNLEIMKLVIQETKTWLSKMGLSISEEKPVLRRASQTFHFLGFQIAYVKVQDKFRVQIQPSKNSIMRIISKVRVIIQNNKAASAYELICRLRPVLLGWANYFKFVECKKTFSKIDNIVYQQIRAWVFRRAVRQGREKVKEKYFPIGNTYKFEGRDYKANWVLNGAKTSKANKGKTIHLPKISWVKSSEFVKIKGKFSVYDGNEVYWATRTPRYSSLSTRVKNLLLRQRNKCQMCSKAFKEDDIIEVDHITPQSKGGRDTYSNLQLLHRQCHVTKTKKDLSKS
jgi:RNA-directed DNA polymerase